MKGEGVDEIPKTMILRRASLIDTDSEGETEQKTKLHSLISIMVSTIMCLAAKCPLPKSNIQATKLFLSTVVNDSGETPRNINGLLTILKNYDGPYEGEPRKEIKCERVSSLIEPVVKSRETNPPLPTNLSEKVAISRHRSRLPSQGPVRSGEQRKQSWNL